MIALCGVWGRIEMVYQYFLTRISISINIGAAEAGKVDVNLRHFRRLAMARYDMYISAAFFFFSWFALRRSPNHFVSPPWSVSPPPSPHVDLPLGSCRCRPGKQLVRRMLHGGLRPYFANEPFANDPFSVSISRFGPTAVCRSDFA